jgi:acyl dehydratase
MERWSVVAQNLPEHARNPIHTDDGARAAGFASALVAGVTTYAYLCHLPLTAWGVAWLAGGTATVRFKRPVAAGDLLVCEPDATGIHALVGGDVRAIATATLGSVDVAPARAGDRLRPLEVELVGEFGSEYAARAGDALDVCAAADVVHPAVWPALANEVVHAQLAEGSWIHVRSAITHVAAVPAGATAVVESVVVDRFQRSGERAVLDVRITVDDQLVAALEHEAIIRLPAGR